MSAKKQLLILLLLPFFSGLSWSQNFNFQFDCDWVEEDNRCVPCAHDGFTGEIFSNRTNTDFYFEHNQVCNSLDVKVEIFTVSGKLVKTIIETVHSKGFRSEGINWNGIDDYGEKLGRGAYVYRLSIETEQGNKAEKIEKLVIL